MMISTGFSPGSPVYAATPMVKNAVFVDKNNHSFIPFRFLNGYSGITTTWNPAEKRMDIVKKDIKLTLYLGQATAYINDKPVSLTELAFSDNGITYVPLSFVSKALGMQLEWNAMASSISLKSEDISATLPVLTGALNQQESQAIVSGKKNYKVGSRSFSVQTVTITLLHPKVKLDVVLAGDTVGKVEELSSLAKRNNAIVAINGTFFDAYTKGDYKAPYGYIVSGGKMLKNSSGDRRAIFTYDKNHLAALIPGLDFKDRFAAKAIEGGLQAGPRLLTDGKISLDVKGEGFKDPKILTGGGARSALGLTRDHKLILLTSSGATIPQLAEIMKQAGAYQAMNLDGGASSGLYYNGKYLTTPGRQISNAIVIKYQ
ncbi:copper amine oxidase [Paenibacillus wynnii]|uniref:Copper amine oxidase n=2 Tax=Paenibacillus wynnii TaxID=268407 RepID=A0A098M985_9BACL|nr:copper amine oxidase [Paenibacillus wynnii]